MSKSPKIILGALAGLVILIAVALLFFVDANVYKPRLEAAASEVLGMEVKVGGRMGIGFFPSPSVTLEEVHIRNRGSDLVSAKEARLGIELLPLLRNEVRFAKIALKRPSISIERGRDGKYNFENPEAAGESVTRPGPGENFSFRRDSPLCGQTIRGRIRGRGLQRGRAPPAAFGRRKART